MSTRAGSNRANTTGWLPLVALAWACSGGEMAPPAPRLKAPGHEDGGVAGQAGDEGTAGDPVAGDSTGPLNPSGGGSPRLSLTWEQVESGPPPMHFPSMVYDEAHSRIVVFGSLVDGGDELWERTGDGWRQLTPQGDVPPANGTMTYDSVRERLVYLGDVDNDDDAMETWELDGDTWTRVDTATRVTCRRRAAMGFDPVRGVVVVFSGYERVEFFCGSSSDTWEFDGNDWREVVTEAAPRRRRGAGMVYSPERGGMFLFGGGASDSEFADTWVYDETGWTDLTSDVYPRQRRGMGLIYTPANERLLLYGGAITATTGQGTVHGDSWLFGTLGWSEVEGGTQPPPRWGHGMVYDLDRERVVVFGGVLVSGWLRGTPTPAIDEIWELTY